MEIHGTRRKLTKTRGEQKEDKGKNDASGATRPVGKQQRTAMIACRRKEQETNSRKKAKRVGEDGQKRKMSKM